MDTESPSAPDRRSTGTSAPDRRSTGTQPAVTKIRHVELRKTSGPARVRQHAGRTRYGGISLAPRSRRIGDGHAALSVPFRIRRAGRGCGNAALSVPFRVRRAGRGCGRDITPLATPYRGRRAGCGRDITPLATPYRGRRAGYAIIFVVAPVRGRRAIRNTLASFFVRALRAAQRLGDCGRVPQQDGQQGGQNAGDEQRPHGTNPYADRHPKHSRGADDQPFKIFTIVPLPRSGYHCPRDPSGP
jgi:hypothetical protein